MPAANRWKFDADKPAIWREQVDGAKGAITLRHPAYPYVVELASDDPADLRDIASDYLRKVAAPLGLPRDLLVPRSKPKFWEFTSRPTGFQLAWLPVGGGSRDSRWVTRYRDPATRAGPIDRSLVLLAVQTRVANDEGKALWSRHGIRIVVHLSPGDRARWKIRITSASCSIGLAEALDPANPGILNFFPNFDSFSVDEFKETISPDLRAAAGLGSDTAFSIDGLRFLSGSPNAAAFELYINVPRPVDKPNALAFAVNARLTRFANGNIKLESVAKRPWVAHARTDLFAQDPPSLSGLAEIVNGRPNREPESTRRARLKRFWTNEPLPGAAEVGGNVTLHEDFGSFDVMQSKLVNPAADESQVQVVPLAHNTHPRTYAFAAFSAYQHARELFDRMRGYGIAPADYFSAAALPVHVRYRATIRPGPGRDGRTVNAQVDYDPPVAGVEEAAGALKPLQVRFALADVKRSASHRKQPRIAANPREPLGLAADPRWSWHEYGHVLLAASTGGLELPFVHSVGDALAAIVCDPKSQLATHARMRGATFPWVYLNRRHDRSAFLGWSWSGTHHRQADFPTENCNCRHKGYLSEQILSTSLFRLYLSLGGDTVLDDGSPDTAEREVAADYAVYLIMRAIALLGPGAALPAQSPDQLVTALIEADIGTWPDVLAAPSPREFGGCAHKVVRWAFEAQGLYATTDPKAVINAPGNPPAVDIYIDTYRPDSEGAHKRGGYMPASLDWKAAKGPKPWRAAPDKSAWHARDDALEIKNKKLFVHVRNRGSTDANGVKVRAMWTDWPVAPAIVPPWTDWGKWKSLTPAEIGPQDVLAGGVTRFGPFKNLPAPKNVYVVLAEATCAADRANTDPAAGYPCSASQTPIINLVAGDNNLALRFYDNR